MQDPSSFDFDKAYREIAALGRKTVFFRWIAMAVFGWMLLTGFFEWPSCHHPGTQNQLLMADDFEAIAKGLTGLVGMVLVDISMSLAVIMQRDAPEPPKSTK